MSRKNLILTLSGAIVLSISIGIWVSLGNVFTEIYLGFCAMGFLGLTIIIGITDLIRNKRLSIYPGTVFICLSLALVTSVVANKREDNIKQSTAEEILQRLRDYKGINGHYPASLDVINSIDTSTDFTYWTDSIGNTFVLSYNYDGWSKKIYDSNRNQWRVID